MNDEAEVEKERLLHESLRGVLEHAERATVLLEDRPFGDGGTTMLFPRLQRAASNQVEGGTATISRYGIWAMTGRDHLAAAIEHMDAGRIDEARALLVHVANSFTAFAGVQRALEDRDGR